MNLNAEGGGVGAKTGLYAVPVLTPDRLEKRQHGRRFKENGEPAFTLTQQDIHGVMIANAVDQDGYLRFGHRPRDENGRTQLLPIGYRRIRRLTPIECERLQGFPDNWTKFGIQEAGKIVHDEGTDDEWVEIPQNQKGLKSAILSDTSALETLLPST